MDAVVANGMEPIQSSDTCPRCKSVASLIMHTHPTGEQAGTCGACGLSFERKVVVGEGNRPVMGLEGKFQYVEKTTENWAAVHVIAKDGEAHLYAVPSEEVYTQQLLPALLEQEALIAEIIVSRLGADEEITRSVTYH